MNKRIKRTLSVLAAVLLLFSVLPLSVSADNTAEITANVTHPHTVTVITPHPGGEVLIVAPTTVCEGDTVSFTPVPEPGYVLKSIVWYTDDPTKVTDITAEKELTVPNADVFVKVEFAALCTVSFDMQGHGTQISPITGVVAGFAISAPAPEPTAANYTFGGWYKEAGCTTAWNFRTDVITENTTLYAKWIKNNTPKATISGNVTEEGKGAVPNATVELFLGTVKVAATKTDEHGRYGFESVENGIYNIVVTDEGGKTKTELVTVDKTGGFTCDVVLPEKSVNSVVEHTGSEILGAKSDISQTVVGGLDAIAAKQNPGDGENITIKLQVEPKADTGTDEQKDIKKAAGNGKNVEFLDMSLWKQVNNGNPDNIGDENDMLLTIVISFDFTKVEVSSIMILRNHGGKTAKLTAMPNEYGEYFAVDANAGIITLYAMKFSEYAIAYDAAHEHEWDTDFTVDSNPTCTQNGSKSIHCKTCSEVKDVTSVPATGHSFGDWQIVTAPTCEGKGSEKRSCSVCKFTETREIAPAGHEWETDFTADIEPTCTKDGSKSIHCKHCDAVKDSTVIPAVGHSFGDWQTVTAPTCEGKGSEKRSCSVCKFTETREIAPAGHEWETDFTVDKEPTCTKDGSKSIHCKKCNATKDAASFPATGHHFGEWIAVTSATCTGNGSEKRVCSVCGYTEMRNVDPAGHEWKTDFTVDKEPTCTKDGSKSIHCKHCDAAKDSTVLPAVGHSFGEWQTVTAPACEGKGSEKRSCSVCGHEETREIAPAGHEWETDFTVDKEPTCTKDGSESIHCKRCDTVKDSTVLPAVGHSFGEWQTVTAPACEGKGSEKRSCSVCGHEETREIAPAGHEWETDFTVDKEPTCTKDGSESIHCKHCDAVKDSTVIPHTAHKWGSETVVKEATETKDGEKTYICEKCGEVRHLVIPKTGDAHRCVIHWFMIALLALFLILFAVFTVLKKKLPVYIACCVCGAAAIVLAFFGGCTVCTVFTVVNLVVIAAGVIYTVLRKNVSDDNDDNGETETEQQEQAETAELHRSN